MELLKDLELVDVTFEDKQASLIFLDSERGEIRQVNWNKQAFDKVNKKFYDDAEQEERIERQAQEIFGLTFDRLAEAIGERKDVYCYDTYNSLYESKTLAQFDNDYIGQIMEVEVTDVVDDGNKITIKFDYEGQTYGSNMRYSDWLEAKQQYFVNPIRKKKQFAKFEEKYGIPVERKEELVGKKVMIEIKTAFNKTYVEVKPFPKKKK